MLDSLSSRGIIKIVSLDPTPIELVGQPDLGAKYESLVEPLIKGIGSDSFQAVLKSDIKSVVEAFETIETQVDDKN